MNVLELFAGIGGLSLGLERAGMTCVGQVEIDPFCRAVLDRHWPEVPKHDDVRTTVGWWYARPRPDVELIAGGFPCQGHSVAGKRRGTDDERWGWPWFRDVVAALAPPFVLIENVPHLTRTGLIDVLTDLAGLGFDAWWFRVPAAAVGAPHLRWRLFTIAAKPDVGFGSGGTWTTRTATGYDGADWTLADTSSEGLEGPRRLHNPATAGRSGSLATHDGGWAAEPDVGRVAHGVPARVDRLRTLGNAVVPAVGEYVGRLILTGAGRG